MHKNPAPVFLAFFFASALGIAFYFVLPSSWTKPSGTRSLSSVDAPVEYEKLRRARTIQIGSPFGSGKMKVDFAQAVANSARVRTLNPSGFQPSAILPRGLKLSVSLDTECLKRGRGSQLSAQIANPADSGLAVEARTYELPSDTEMNLFGEAAEVDECILGVAAEGKVRKNGYYDDPNTASQNQLTALGAAAAHDFFFRSSLVPPVKVRIAIVDTGIDYNHPDLAPVMWRDASGHYGYDLENGDSDPYDDESHGTHVAGIAAARGGNGVGVAGVMPYYAELMAVKVLDAEGSGTYSNVANGIRWAVDNGAHVINLSLSGGGTSAVVEDALVYAANHGVFVSLAAGNSNAVLGDGGSFVTPASYGARYQGVMTVGAIDALTHRRSSFSNYGNGVEIAAPGSNGIYSTLPGAIYDTLAGTSMAAPAVAGAAALAIGALRAMDVPYTAAEVEALLLRSSVRNAQLEGLVRDRAELNLPRLTETLRHDYLLSLEGGLRADVE